MESEVGVLFFIHIEIRVQLNFTFHDDSNPLLCTKQYIRTSDEQHFLKVKMLFQ